MKSLFTIDTLRLAKEYSDASKWTHRQILEKFVVISFNHNGFLPNTFDIPIRVKSGDIVRDVLEDLGYLHVRDILCFNQTTHVRIS